MNHRIDDPATRLRELTRQATFLTGNRADADDLVQESMVRALTYVKDGDSIRNWPAYLRRVLRNVRADAVGRRARAGTTVTLDDAAHQVAVPAPQPSKLLLRELGEALDRLPTGQRRVVHLVAVDGLSYQDAADRLGVPVGTVMSRLHRGRNALRDAIGDEAPAVELNGFRDGRARAAGRP